MNVRLQERKPLLRKNLLKTPLEYRPGQNAIYSDLGFIMLEWIIEERSGESLRDYLRRHLYGPIGLQRTFLGTVDCPAFLGEDQFAATEECPWRQRTMIGCVDDENAYALGGYSGHAGLFGTASDVFDIVSLLRLHFRGQRDDFFKPPTVRTFFTRQESAPGSSWALGWDTPSPSGSSSGRYFSPRSVGHLGFTGTSVWMDLEKDVIVILLTNRVHPTRKNEKIKAFRPVLHDTVMETLGKDSVS
jgi:CubicO group peptidase (beta-lactamase class C family)